MKQLLPEFLLVLVLALGGCGRLPAPPAADAWPDAGAGALAKGHPSTAAVRTGMERLARAFHVVADADRDALVDAAEWDRAIDPRGRNERLLVSLNVHLRFADLPGGAPGVRAAALIQALQAKARVATYLDDAAREFARLDLDDDGALTRAELKPFLARHRAKPVFGDLDLDGDDRVTPAELAENLLDLMAERWEDQAGAR